MAEGRSNQAIGERLFITQRAVEKHVTSIFAQAPAAGRRRRPPPRARRARLPAAVGTLRAPYISSAMAARAELPELALLERDAELATFQALADAARRGEGGVVAIEGTAGIGKTRLLAEARAAAGARAARAHRARRASTRATSRSASCGSCSSRCSRRARRAARRALRRRRRARGAAVRRDAPRRRAPSWRATRSSR